MALPSTVNNPQSNGICKKNHKKVADILQVTLHTNPPQNINEANELIDAALATAMYAIRCAVSATLNKSTGALAYNRNMFMDVPLIEYLNVIRDRRQHLIDENLRRQNAKRVDSGRQH